MKKIFVIGIMLLATVSFVAAQQGQGQRQQRTPEESAKIQTDRMVELLKLSADQKTKIEAIDLDLAKQWNTKRQSAQGNREAMTAARQEIEKLRETKYKAVLTADQFKKFSEDREQQQSQRRQGGQRNN